MKYKGVIFDLDGTLENTLEDLADSANWSLRKLGVPEHPVDSYRLKIGSGRRILAELALPPDRQDLLDDFIHLMWQRYSAHYLDKTRLYDGVAEMLGELRERGVRLAVLSNKPHEFAELMVRELMADVEFEIVLGHRDGAVAKPDPAGALGIAAEMGIEPSRFLYVGDTDIDMMTGRSAGMFTVGVLWGFRDRAELLGAGAEALAEKPMDLVRLAEKGRC